MLANFSTSGPCIGNLDQQVQKPGTFFYELIAFIADELPTWRDRLDRHFETAETLLTSQVCAHLNSVCRRAAGWDILQFRPEEADESERGRRIDLVAAPAACTIIIEGRSYVDFDILMPIECKRLPTPRDRDRDEREYVFSERSSAGGIQRFKTGAHGAQHRFGAMIGYLQEGSPSHWSSVIRSWIDGLAGQPGWSADDHLSIHKTDASRRITALHSRHKRANALPDIDLEHLWIEMNRSRRG